MAMLLRAIVAGDRSASEWLYDSFAAPLYRRLTRRYAYPGGPEIDDLLHDTFVLCFRNRAALISRLLDRVPVQDLCEARVERFLWDQACGLASNRRRSAAVRMVVAIADQPPPVDPADEEKEFIDRDILGRLLDCLRGKGQRLFLYLGFRYCDGLKPEQIAAATGWSRKATYKLKQALNKAVAECAEGLGIAIS